MYSRYTYKEFTYMCSKGKYLRTARAYWAFTRSKFLHLLYLKYVALDGSMRTSHVLLLYVGPIDTARAKERSSICVCGQQLHIHIPAEHAFLRDSATPVSTSGVYMAKVAVSP